MNHRHIIGTTFTSADELRRFILTRCYMDDVEEWDVIAVSGAARIRLSVVCGSNDLLGILSELQEHGMID